MKREADLRTSAQPDPAVDAALRSLGSATPTPGFEGRILTRLASARLMQDAASESAPGVLARWLGHANPALGLVSACLVGAIIVAGSVSYSRRSRPTQAPPPPAIMLPGPGVGAASAVHPAAPPSSPVTPDQAAHGRSSHRAGQGRARIAPHAHKPSGVAVPDPASPQN